MNQIERAFLDIIDYRLKVEQSELDKHLQIIFTRSQELQCKQFRIYNQDYKFIENYYTVPKSSQIQQKENKTVNLKTQNSSTNKFSSQRKLPQIISDDKIFKNNEENYQFSNYEEI